MKILSPLYTKNKTLDISPCDSIAIYTYYF